MSAHRQRGSALIPAIFLLVIVATLAAFAVRMGSSQRHATTLALVQDRAVAAANAGLEWGARRALTNNLCNAQTLNLNQGALNGFSVDVRCVQPFTDHVEGAITIRFVDVTATARWGTYGTAEYVSRTITRRFSNAPDF